MKRTIFITCVIAFSLCSVAVAGTAEASSGCGSSSCSACAKRAESPRAEPCVPAGNDMVRKLGRGAANILTFPGELYNQMEKVSCQSGAFAGLTWGLVRGVGMMGLRVVVGVYEVATFPVPVPAGYRPILTDPEFFFTDASF